MRKRNIIAMLKKAGYTVKMSDGTLHFERFDATGQGGCVHWKGDINFHGDGDRGLWYYFATCDKLTFTVDTLVWFHDYVNVADKSYEDFIDLALALV